MGAGVRKATSTRSEAPSLAAGPATATARTPPAARGPRRPRSARPGGGCTGGPSSSLVGPQRAAHPPRVSLPSRVLSNRGIRRLLLPLRLPAGVADHLAGFGGKPSL